MGRKKIQISRITDERNRQVSVTMCLPIRSYNNTNSLNISCLLSSKQELQICHGDET